MQCVSPVFAGPWRNGKAPAPARAWHPHSSSSKTAVQNCLLCTAGEELGVGDNPHKLNTRQ